VRRVHRALLVPALAAAVACSASDPGPPPVDPTTDVPSPGNLDVARRFLTLACSLPGSHLRRIWTGFSEETSGDVQLVARVPNYYGNHSHSGPWPYLQRVPMLLYGPGHVPSVGEVGRPVTVADLPATLARYLDFEFRTPDGTPMDEAIEADAQPPRLIVVVVWDGGGRNVLQEWPREWPTLRRLAREGAWFDRATVGSSPSVTPAVHATIGTGAFPRRHGLTDLYFREDGRIVSIRDGTSFLREPTLADRFDRELGNEPIVGMLANSLTTGMVGHGAAFPGGDRDLVVLHGEDSAWTISDALASDFAFPSSVNDVPGLEDAVRELDLEDGRLDGSWLGEPVLEDANEWVDTPAFSGYQTEVIRELIRSEGFGADDVPDLLYVNYKQIDKVGHKWSMNSPQMEAVVASSDRALGELVDALNREVGRGEWVLALTSDHGSTPDASVSGAFVIDIRELQDDLRARFDDDDDRDVLQGVRVTQIWLDVAELEENGFTVDEVARFLNAYTQGDNAEGEAVSETLPPDEADVPVYEAAFPSAALVEAPCL
jgi:predicted AlkP superfamily pyrophosphatase or phosphodiesterase